MRQKGKHVRRLNVTEGLLFVVLWGGNEASEGGKGSRTRGGDEEEGDSGNSALAEARTSGSLQTGASLPNRQHYNQTNAAQETASTLGIKQLWHKIKHSAIRRSTLHTQVARRLRSKHTLCQAMRLNVENTNSPRCLFLRLLKGNSVTFGKRTRLFTCTE